MTTYESEMFFQHLVVADNFIDRCRGLMCKPRLPDDEALLIERCSCIHTFWMRFPIDVVFLDRSGMVLCVIDHVPARRIVANRRAWQVLECNAGEAQVRKIYPGVVVALVQSRKAT